MHTLSRRQAVALRALLELLALACLLAFCFIACEARAQSAGQANTRGGCTPGAPCVGKSFRSTTTTASSTGLCIPIYSGSYSIGLGSTANVNEWGWRVYTGPACAGAVIQTFFTYALVSGAATFPAGYSLTANDLTAGLILRLNARMLFAYDFANPNAIGGGGYTGQQLEYESGTKHFWSVGLNNVAKDLQSGAHPVLDKRTLLLTMGVESASAPTCEPACPRSGGAALTVTTTDAAAAGGVSSGSAPNTYDYRTSTTGAVAGSTSSVILSGGFADLGRAPRWCQRVMPGATITSVRYWAGLATTLPGSTDAPAIHHASFRFSTDAGDTKWAYCYGAGATTCAATDVTVSASTVALLCIDCREGTACTWSIDGIPKARIASGLPSQKMSPFYSIEARAASARSANFSHVSTEYN